MENSNTVLCKNGKGVDLASLQALDMTVKPYGEVKKALDKRAHETMRELRAFVYDLLSFENEKK